GVLKSTDGGNTWQTTGLTFNLADGVSVNKLLIHPNNNNIIYAATSKGIYKTSNAGVNWTKIFSTKYIYDMEFKPGDPSIIYASNKYWGEIYKLTNNGNNSERVYDEYSFGARRIELAISPKSSSKLYALVANSDGGLYEIAISNNSGSAFSTLYKPGDPPSASKPNLLCKQEHGDEEGGQGWYDLALIVDPNNANVLYCGGVNTWKSTDGGHSWELNNFWTDYYCSYCEIVHADKHYFAYNGNTLYECNDGGLYKTINGSDWINISNGIINSQIYKVGVSQTNKNDIIVGLQDNGTKKYQSGIWTNAFGGDGMDCFIDYTDNNVQYGEIQRGGKLRRTLNNWFNYTNIKPSNAIDEGAWVTPFLMDPKDHNTIYVGYKHIYKSTDKGNNWSRIFTHNTDDKFRHIAVSPSNTKVIYAYSYGSGTGYLWKTINGGANNNWTNISVNLPDNLITSITVKNDDPNTVWITLGGYDSKVVYQSTNGGNTWSNISSGLPDIPANTIVQNIQNHNKTELYIGTDFGVYLKLGSSNWTLFNSNLPKVVVNDLEIYYDATPGYSKLRAATYGRGLWESDLFSVATAPIANFTSDKKTITPGDTISFTDLSLNAPASWSWEFEGGNPHTSSLQNPMIEYSTPGTYKVKLTVTNSFGSNSITKEQYITVICNLLNYHSTDAEIIAGTYHDLGNKGSVIITDNYDDSNSEPIDIGFDFEYNCVSFSSFILNTNGFIKLGNTPPSKPDLFYQSSQHNDFGLFDSAEPEDVNLISIFNHDLEAGNNPEYRVFTSGTAPNRICTIQFKGIKDKTTSPAVFYDNMEFQIKLYETSNNIEFVYGDWDYGDAYDSFKTAACGLKGSGSGKNQLLVVGKSSSKGWDEVYFLNNNYKKDDNFVYGLNFGNYVSRPKPDQGITYRFIPGSDRNINTNALYALGESSINYGNPQNISALLINTGNNPILNFDVQLNISNANIFTDIITVPAIYPGDTLLVTFASFNPTNLGENNITISVPDDDNMDDNALSWTQRTTLNKFNYSFDKTPDSGYGYTYGNSGMFASKYHISGNAKIESIDVFIFNYSENIGQMVYTAVLDTLGNIIAQSDKITLTSQDLGKWKSFKINDSPTFTNTDILTGFASTESNTSNAYYAMGIQNEKPSRPSTFYWTGIDGGTLNDFGADWGYRFMMGFTAASSNPV
ncbi:MAG TPA: PKD domain-containing protein, partial [Bacteroidetes bacterium]|nr:PKD domain-containing protein [Bacteroidota bacterium]